MSEPLCRHFLQGRCAFGSVCRLSHGPQQAPKRPEASRPAQPVASQATPASSSSADPRRVDPEDGKALTFEELTRRYRNSYSDAEIESYWKECRPVAASKAAPPPPPPAASNGLPPCKFFLKGSCSFGQACRSPHVRPGASESLPQRRHQEPVDTGPVPGEEVECGICFENIIKRGQRFGMLESCDHSFCLSCIRSWRREREQQDRQNLRLCPVCRNESFFVIPSDELIRDPEEKRKVIEDYKLEMGRIPCKLFDYGRGECAFGTSCFYAHLNPDGTRYIPPPLRWMLGADGNEVRSEVKLSDFF